MIKCALEYGEIWHCKKRRHLYLEVTYWEATIHLSGIIGEFQVFVN